MCSGPSACGPASGGCGPSSSLGGGGSGGDSFGNFMQQFQNAAQGGFSPQEIQSLSQALMDIFQGGGQGGAGGQSGGGGGSSTCSAPCCS